MESYSFEFVQNDWDPMSEDFKSSSNTIHLNDECAETMFLGWRNTDAKRQCKYHRAGRQCPRGENCPWEHTAVSDGKWKFISVLYCQFIFLQ